MLYVGKEFRALCAPYGSGYYRYPTEEVITSLGEKDALEGDVAPGCIVYRDLNNFKGDREIKSLRWKSWAVVVLICLLILAVALRTVMYGFQMMAGSSSAIPLGIGVGSALLLSYFLYHAIMQAIEPVVIDVHRNRIALRDGKNTMFSKDIVEFARSPRENSAED